MESGKTSVAEADVVYADEFVFGMFEIGFQCAWPGNGSGKMFL